MKCIKNTIIAPFNAEYNHIGLHKMTIRDFVCAIISIILMHSPNILHAGQDISPSSIYGTYIGIKGQVYFIGKDPKNRDNYFRIEHSYIGKNKNSNDFSYISKIRKYKKPYIEVQTIQFADAQMKAYFGLALDLRTKEDMDAKIVSQLDSCCWGKFSNGYIQWAIPYDIKPKSNEIDWSDAIIWRKATNEELISINSLERLYLSKECDQWVFKTAYGEAIIPNNLKTQCASPQENISPQTPIIKPGECRRTTVYCSGFLCDIREYVVTGSIKTLAGDDAYIEILGVKPWETSKSWNGIELKIGNVIRFPMSELATCQ